MKLEIPYGHSRRPLALPARLACDTIAHNHGVPLRDPVSAIRNSLRQPIGSPSLRDIVKPGESVAVVVNDITRLVRTELFLPILVDELNSSGISDHDIFVVFALGNHRPLTPGEQRQIVGDDLARRLELVNHDCHEESHLVRIGRTTRGNEVTINRRVWEADRVILTGEVMYHLIAGYSGGRKSAFPGIAGAEFIRVNHRLVLDDACKAGLLEGNPAHEDLLEACRFLAPDFILNVVLSPEGGLLGVFAGHYDEAHRAACRQVDQIYGVPVLCEYDLVIAGAGGFPLDIDLRQAHKGMESAARAVRDGGCLLYFAECAEGYGSAAFQEWAGRFQAAAELREALQRNFIIGAHKAYWLARLSERIQVVLVSALDSDIVRRCYLQPSTSPEELIAGLEAKKGRGMRVAYLPSASFTLPLLTRAAHAPAG
jgi:lactate racemase